MGHQHLVGDLLLLFLEIGDVLSTKSYRNMEGLIDHFNNKKRTKARNIVLEGVSGRRSFPNAEYTRDIKYIITRYLGFERMKQGATSHIKFTRESDGTNIGLKLARKNMIMKGHPWKQVLGDVFWWVSPDKREDLWALARKTKGKDSRVMPPRRRDVSKMVGVREKVDIVTFEEFINEQSKKVHYAVIAAELGKRDDGTRHVFVKLIPSTDKRVRLGVIKDVEVVKVIDSNDESIRHPFYFLKLVNQQGLSDDVIIKFER